MTASEALIAWLKMVLMIAVPVILLLATIVSVVAFAGKSSRNRRERD